MIGAYANSEINGIGDAVQTACLGIPFVGPAVGLLLNIAVHGAFAAAESALDLVYLRNGHKVKLLKMNKSDWKLSIDGIAETLRNLSDGDSTETIEEHNKEEGISYEQYMLIFFIVKSLLEHDPIGVMTDRTGNLIEWNVINYNTKACADNIGGDGNVNTDAAVAAMSAAFGDDNCFRLAKRHTDFDLTATIDLRLLFLTMPMFTRQGSPFSSTLRITATDMRGY
jgi:hypothetical protein